MIRIGGSLGERSLGEELGVVWKGESAAPESPAVIIEKASGKCPNGCNRC